MLFLFLQGMNSLELLNPYAGTIGKHSFGHQGLLLLYARYRQVAITTETGDILVSRGESGTGR